MQLIYDHGSAENTTDAETTFIIGRSSSVGGHSSVVIRRSSSIGGHPSPE